MISGMPLCHTTEIGQSCYWRCTISLDVLVDDSLLDGGEKLCRRESFAAAEKFKYP